MATWKLLAIIGASGVGLCCVSLVIIGLIVGPQPDKPAANKADVVATVPASRTAAGSAATTPAATPATTKPAAPTTSAAAAPAPSSLPPREICRFTENGGTYYRLVTSATDHDFRACTGGTPYPGTLDDLFGVPNMDRRCILGDQATVEYNALVAVYSDTTTPNLAAARAYCKAHGGTN
jgi:hypothetical protein